MNRKIWVILLTAWLVLWGILMITDLKVKASDVILGCLAIATGILLILDK